MQTPIELTASVRDDHGKGYSRRLRRDGKVPAVLYAAGTKPVSLTVEPRGLRKAVTGPLGFNQLLTFKLDGTGTKTVMAKDLQLHPVRHDIIHADFIEVDPSKPVKVNVPVVLVGKNKNITAGGVIEQVNRTVAVMALANAIPEKIEVDISEMKMGDTIHVRDVKMPEGLKTIGEGKETIATISMVREEKGAAQAAAAAAPEAAKGAAPAAAGAKAAEAKPAAKK